jgi:tetratricopeptide (TPR) repeat protein
MRTNFHCLTLWVVLVVAAWAVPVVDAANTTYRFGEQEVNLGWPHATADWHAHHIPSFQDEHFFDMKARYDLFLDHGKKHLTRGLKRAACEDLAHAVAIEPFQPYARRLLAHALFGLGDYAAAAAQMRRSMHLSRNFQRLDIEWKEYSGGKNDYKRDKEELRRACARDPGSSDTLFLLGVYEYFDHRPREALTLFEGAQRLAPGDRDIEYFVHAARKERD